MTQTSKDNPLPEASAQYEPSELAIGWIVALVVGLAVLSVGLGLLTWDFMRAYAHPIRPADQPRSIVLAHEATAAPPLEPAPGHDQTVEQDLAALRQNEDAVLEHLGWQRDPSSHRVIVPEALAQVVARRTHAGGAR